MQLYDMVIKNGTILTMDSRNRVIKNGWLGIKDDSIIDVGDDSDLPKQGKQIIDAKGGLILPGLVNGHTHAAMSLFRGLADDLPLMEWLNNYIFPAEGKMDKTSVHAGTLLACAEMILSGTTTFCDMYLFDNEVAMAAKAAGMRCLVGEVLYDFPSPNYGQIEKGLEYTESLILNWADDPLVSIAVEPHSPYTCSSELLTSASEMALKYNVPLIIHMSESQSEILEIKEKYGKQPFEHLLALKVLGPHMIADHCVWVDDREMEIMADHNIKVIHNPESNMKLASGFSPVPKMIEKGITVGLGTDGCASNNNLDLFSEMDTAAKLHKINTMDPTVMDALTVFRMATIQGAEALRMGTIIGSIENGKKADVIIVDTYKPHLTPMYNPYSHLVYAVKGSDVSHSIINGQLVMADRKLLTLDLDVIIEHAREQSAKITK